MLKRRLCEARLTWRLHCDGPLLIADGRYEKERDKGKLPQKVFISRSSHRDMEKAVKAARSAEEVRLPFYVPGTSLRGPVRAQAERILRTLIPGAVPATACDPFQQEPGPAQSCSKRLDTPQAGTVPYAAACPACRLFGCTGTASRIQISDADIEPTYRSVFRDMIGIDRFTGGVFQGETNDQGEKRGGGANMRLHALEGATFSTQITLVNFELWQLGLLAFVFRDFEDGLVSIGFGKTKGFGQVQGRIEKVELVYPKGRPQGRIHHLQSLVTSEDERLQYDLLPFEAPSSSMALKGSSRLELYDTFEVPDISAFWETVAPAFLAFIEAKQEAA